MWLLDRRRPKDAFPVEVEHADGAVVGVKAGEGLGAEVARNGGVVVVDYKVKVVLGVDAAPTNALGQGGVSATTDACHHLHS